LFRYISPCEAAWRIFGFDLHHSSTSVQRLSIHLPGEQNIIYDDDEDVEDVLNKEENQTSQFLAFLKTNKKIAEDPEAKNLLTLNSLRILCGKRNKWSRLPVKEVYQLEGYIMLPHQLVNGFT